jgi:hypothetical protein
MMMMMMMMSDDIGNHGEHDSNDDKFDDAANDQAL